MNYLHSLTEVSFRCSISFLPQENTSALYIGIPIVLTGCSTLDSTGIKHCLLWIYTENLVMYPYMSVSSSSSVCKSSIMFTWVLCTKYRIICVEELPG